MKLEEVCYKQSLQVILSNDNEKNVEFEIRENGITILRENKYISLGKIKFEIDLKKRGVFSYDFFVDNKLIGSRILQISNYDSKNNNFAIQLLNDGITDFVGKQRLEINWGG